jgi:signal transduction histidine kinase
VGESKPDQLEWLFGLIVHDLRNPAATLAANLGFVREGMSDPTLPRSELDEALGDSQQALGDLMRGLDQLAWMGRWFNSTAAFPVVVEDVRKALERARARIKHGVVEFSLPAREIPVRGGEALERLVELLVSNGQQHAQGKPVRVSVAASSSNSAAPVVIEVADEGRPLSPAFVEQAFTLPGQLEIKGRADGRYGRVLGLFAAGILAECLGARLSSEERDGKNVFLIALLPG